MNKTYSMSKSQANKLLEIAKNQVKKGIYAIEKNNILELRNDKLSITKSKELKRALKQQGFKVYSNGV